MAAITLGQRKCHRTMTASAKAPLQYCKHIDRRGANLGSEYTVVAVNAVQPFGMRLMGELHHRHAGCIIHNTIHIQLLDTDLRVKVSAWRDETLA